jgi:aspartate kinase
MEENISEIFALFHQFKLKVNLIQNSAISFSVCVEDKFDNFTDLNAIYQKIKVDFSENVTLYTIRHFTDAAAQTVEEGKKCFKTNKYRNNADCEKLKLAFTKHHKSV